MYREQAASLPSVAQRQPSPRAGCSQYLSVSSNSPRRSASKGARLSNQHDRLTLAYTMASRCDWREKIVTTEILAGYEDAADALIKKFEAISSVDLFQAVHDDLPGKPSRILDIGAGTGRDAAWFASQSHTVVAVEPVDGLRTYGMSRHTSPNITWLDDSLPELLRTSTLGEKFDLIVLSAVWQHLNDTHRQQAFSVLQQLTAKGGKIIMSLRHGPGAPTRRVFPVATSATRALAGSFGFFALREVAMPSIQQQNQENGVTWTWLVLQNEA